MNKKNQSILFYLAAFFIIVGIVLKVINNPLSAYITASGAIIFVLIRLNFLIRYRNNPSNHSRVPAIQLFSAIAMLIMAYFIYKESNAWAAMGLLAALLETYTAYRA